MADSKECEDRCKSTERHPKEDIVPAKLFDGSQRQDGNFTSFYEYGFERKKERTDDHYGRVRQDLVGPRMNGPADGCL